MQTKLLIEKYYRAFNDNDMDTFFSLLAENVIHDVNQGTCDIGKDKFRQFMDHMTSCYDERITDLEIMINDNGTRAAAEFVVEGCYINTDAGLPEANGQSYQLPGGAFFVVSNNKIMRVTTYYNVQAWLEQILESA